MKTLLWKAQWEGVCVPSCPHGGAVLGLNRVERWRDNLGET